MAQLRRPCTCGNPPPSVDLTEAYDLVNLRHDAGDDDQAQAQAQAQEMQMQTQMHATIRRQLVENLQSTGWSPVQLNVDKLFTSDSDPVASCTNTDTARRLRPILQAHALWKEQLTELFEPDVVTAAEQKQIPSPNNVVYRAAESGAPGTVEPKQSWEVLRCNCRKSGGDVVPLQQSDADSEAESIVAERMKEWVSVLHSVALTVRKILQFPENILLHEESCHSNSNSKSNSDDATTSMPCSSDLLRAFLYDTVDATTTSSDGDDSPHSTLGSSPHTDWGSFTVVWQDTVGGLQTFCHGCEKWVDVDVAAAAETPGDSNGVVRFVVHMGDITSLALGHALQETSSSKDRREVATDDSKNIETTSVVWPSPKHRVLSPTSAQKRASLVYFAYPPHDISIREITHNLANWCQRQQERERQQVDSQSLITPNRVPYDEYYLLHNQSMASSVTPEQQFQAIVDRPLKDVLSEKWEQVQRS
jgi:hypothetical protein